MLLHISKHDQSVLKFSLENLAQTQLSIGRSLDNTIVLTDPSVSRTHMTLSHGPQGWSLIDKSKNGVIVDDQIVSKSDITLGSVIAIGPYKIELQKHLETDQPTLVIQKQDATQMFSYNQKTRELTKGHVTLFQTAPLKRKYPLKKTMTTIGKDPQNDIKLADAYVSSFHCKIEKKEDHYVLKDYGSTNGTLLNGQKVREAILKHDDQLHIGQIHFHFSCVKEKKHIEAKDAGQFCNMVSQDPDMKHLFGLIEEVGPTQAPVFIHGETGTGKELIARAIVQSSDRVNAPFLTINCGAISKDLIESELFGHEKGAFTSAHTQRKGLFEQAHTGTLFLDEIGELPIDLQPKLLRVLETGEIRRVGGDQTIHVDVRIVSATHRNLEEEINHQRFREDLFFRLVVMPLTLPPLRKRHNDIALLAQHFLTTHADKYNKPLKDLSQEAMELLSDHQWPGNIRELKNILHRAWILSGTSDHILADHIQFFGSRHTHTNQKKTTAPGTLEEVEKAFILDTLHANAWNKTQSAKKLGIAKSTLHLKIQQYELKP